MNHNKINSRAILRSNLNLLFLAGMSFLLFSCLGGTQASDGVSGNDHRIFATSAGYQSNTFTGGTPDAACAAAANAAGLTRTYIALLSNSTLSAINKIGDNGGAIYEISNASGTVEIAPSFNDGSTGLWNTSVSNLAHAIDVDENGNGNSGAAIFTGSTSAGSQDPSTAPIMPASFCNDWSTTGGAVLTTVIIGTSGAADSTWMQNGSQACNVQAHLYCISE